MLRPRRTTPCILIRTPIHITPSGRFCNRHLLRTYRQVSPLESQGGQGGAFSRHKYSAETYFVSLFSQLQYYLGYVHLRSFMAPH